MGLTSNMRIGPVMRAVADFAARNPGAAPYAFARQNLYHGRVSNQFSYNAVHRAERAGLIHLERAKGRAGYAMFAL